MHVAFIGGGSTGPVTLIYLAKFAKEKGSNLHGYTFHLIDPKGFGHGGIAYGECHPKHILNTLRNEMSPWERGKFHQYLLSIGRDDNTLQFNLRSDYRNFLALELAEARKTLESLGAQCVEHQKEARIQKTGKNQFAILDQDSHLIDPNLEKLPAENILLSVGYGPNTNFETLWQYKDDGYIHSLYPSAHLQKTLQSKKKPVRIAVLGSAAALYDFVIACPIAAADTKLYIFSSTAVKGIQVRQVEKEHLLKDLPLETLRALGKQSSLEDIEKAIEKEFQYAKDIQAGPNTWAAFRMMMIISGVLANVETKVAQEFRRSEAFKNLKRLGSSTTQFSKEVLKTFHPECIAADIRPENIQHLPTGQFTITVGKKAYFVDCIVNATGHGRHNTPILEEMKKQGLAKINPKLDILATDETGYQLIGSGIACIGPATHFGTDGIETFAKPAEKFADALIHAMA